MSPTATPYVPFMCFLHLAQNSSIGLGSPHSTPAGVTLAGGRKFCTRSRKIFEDKLMSNTSNVNKRRLSISLSTVAMRRQEGLHGIPAKDTTLLTHEWFGFGHVRPRPDEKHLLFTSGFKKRGVIKWTGCMGPRDHEGNAIVDTAQISSCWSYLVVFTYDHSGDVSRAP